MLFCIFEGGTVTIPRGLLKTSWMFPSSRNDNDSGAEQSSAGFILHGSETDSPPSEC